MLRPASKDTADFPLKYLPVEPLTEEDAAVRVHFTLPQVQYVGSDTGCSCGFPSALVMNDWYHWEDPEIPEDPGDRFNRNALVDLLENAGETVFEMFAAWNGYPELMIREDISLNRILEREFRFKEQGFYRVHV